MHLAYSINEHHYRARIDSLGERIRELESELEELRATLSMERDAASN